MGFLLKKFKRVPENEYFVKKICVGVGKMDAIINTALT